MAYAAQHAAGGCLQNYPMCVLPAGSSCGLACHRWGIPLAAWQLVECSACRKNNWHSKQGSTSGFCASQCSRKTHTCGASSVSG